MKRTFDIIAAVIGLSVLAPLLLFAAILIKIESRGQVFFRQERIGRGFRPFLIYKFRTMVENATQLGGTITCGDDPRITRVGRFLRKTKFDELPQLINVLKGEMSLVGPRPEVRKYVDLFRADYEEILKVRPGITDIASLKYQDEADLLGRSANPEEEYIKRVLPDKLKLAKDYVNCSCLRFDLALIIKTLPKLIGHTAR
jgi:lipopolysaccharide/colanic/teichoic acid biosynthesis glycosyltransferase